MATTPRRARVRLPGSDRQEGPGGSRGRRISESRLTDLDSDETLTVDRQGRPSVSVAGGGLKKTARGVELDVGVGLQLTDGKVALIGGKSVSKLVDNTTGTVSQDNRTLAAVTTVATAADAIAMQAKKLNDLIQSLKDAGVVK
jgi:hypothetical protein